MQVLWCPYWILWKLTSGGDSCCLPLIQPRGHPGHKQWQGTPDEHSDFQPLTLAFDKRHWANKRVAHRERERSFLSPGDLFSCSAFSKIWHAFCTALHPFPSSSYSAAFQSKFQLPRSIAFRTWEWALQLCPPHPAFGSLYPSPGLEIGSKLLAGWGNLSWQAHQEALRWGCLPGLKCSGDDNDYCALSVIMQSLSPRGWDGVFACAVWGLILLSALSKN